MRNRRLGLAFSGLVGVYGFFMGLLIATSIGLNSYTLQELDAVERLQELLRGMVAVGAILGCLAVVAVAFHPPLGAVLLVVAGVVSAVGLGLAGAGWGVVGGPRVEYYLAPVPLVHWATAGLLTRSILRHRAARPSPPP